MFLTSVFIKNVDHRLTGHFSLDTAIFTNLWYSPECPQGSFSRFFLEIRILWINHTFESINHCLYAGYLSKCFAARCNLLKDFERKIRSAISPWKPKLKWTRCVSLNAQRLQSSFPTASYRLLETAETNDRTTAVVSRVWYRLTYLNVQMQS